MSKIISTMSRLGSYNLLTIVFFIAVSSICSATTPKPTNSSRRVLPEPEIDIGEPLEVNKISANLTALRNSDLSKSDSMISTSLSRKSDDQEAAPTVTSVHQVWTSSSSGSLDELSPELIGKLRQDVPFLAAYALRPRLVGALGSNQQQLTSSSSAPIANFLSDVQRQSPMATSSSGQNSLISSASTPQVSHTEVLGPRLGDISEYRVETSSSSKSEHHHKRKTTLKKKTDDDLEAMRRQIVGSSQLVKKQSGNFKTKSPKSSKKLSGRRLSRSRSKKRVGKNKRRSQSQQRSHRLRLKNRSRGGVARARYYQDGSKVEPTSNEIDGDTSRAKMEMESISMGEQTTTLVDNSGGVKGGSDRGTKGGSGVDRSKQRPFYARSNPNDNPEEVGEDQMREKSDEGKTDKSGASDVDSSNSTDGNDDKDDEGGSEAGVSEPKRVGDDDIEEGGDTVTVMPKSDGVDDDPDINDAPADAAPDEEAQADLPGRERENADSPSESDLEEEPRTKRINRERPNTVSPADNGQSGGGSAVDSAAGGGIGATTGSGSSSGSGRDETDSTDASDASDARRDDDDLPNVTDSSVQPDEDDKNLGDSRDSSGIDESQRGSSERGKSGSRSDKRKEIEPTDETDAEGSGRFEPERSSSRDANSADGLKPGKTMSSSGGDESTLSKEGTSGVDDNEPNDVDYRDEMAEAERKRSKGERKGSDSEKNDDNTVGHHAGGKGSGDKKECDDGSYDPHSPHHSEHNDHHNNIEWLRGAIPGEPGLDYPILSGVNKTDFNCRDQKYPGYYADVDSRCQIFHICQADGRQDSFICPNGTIFSQTTTVCVWWNSFDCEDAPKYYALNALLYKTPASPSTSDLRPRDGTRLSPKVGGVERAEGPSSEESTIDDLIRAMRRSKEATEADEKQSGVTYDISKKAGNMRGSSSLGVDDEATIQRKSTNLDDESELTSSRLRSRAEPRRRRRASIKQAPPKLKSRRVSRNSKRRKLRHGIKPKRRA